MCEYCGCQALPAIEQLTREHDRALDHVRTAEQALRRTDPAAAARACADLRRLLAPHTAVEEQALFPAMASEFGDHVSALVEEHRLIDDVLGEVAVNGPLPADWPVRLQHALSVLRDHVLKEQDGVFPAALSTLETTDWQHLDDVRNRVGSGLD